MNLSSVSGILSYLFSSAVVFPFAAFVITIPYLAHQYRKYGSVPFWRWFSVWLFIYYLITIYFMVILPLPSREYVASITRPSTNFRFFTFIPEFIASHQGFSITDPSTWYMLGSYIILEPVFNMLMFMPFGIMLRWYYGCSWKKTFLFSFLLSLFFELTQLTGLYGYYPRAYRIFDVNDLLANTLGGMAGWLLCPLITKPLPDRKELDEAAYENGHVVTFMRRFIAFFMDTAVMALVFAGSVFLGLRGEYYILFDFGQTVFFIVLFFLTGGQSFGKRQVRLRVTDSRTEQMPAAWKVIIRETVTRFWFTGGFMIAISASSIRSGYSAFISAAWLMTWVILLFDLIHSAFTDKSLWYEEILHTHVISLIET